MNVHYGVRFLRSFRRITRKDNGVIKDKSKKQLQLFLDNPKHSSLRLHKLTGKHDEWSMSIDRSMRLTFQYVPDGILLIDIGTHDQVY